MSEELREADDGQKRYKFMTNILIEPMHRSKYIKPLEKVTADPKVPYQRLIVSMGVAVAAVIVAAWLVFSDTRRSGYVLFPAIVAAVSILALAIMYMLSSRDKSMLKTAFDFLVFKIGERARGEALANNKALHSLGIEDVKRGVILFDNGDVGLMYHVEGQMSFSILPATAEFITSARLQYFVARSDTCQEMLVTSIKNADLSRQMGNFQRIHKSASRSDTLNDQWRAYMAKLNYDYIEQSVVPDEVAIQQMLILRDIDVQSLKKSRQTFETAVANGLYAQVKPIAKKSEVVKQLSGLAMLSNDSVESAVKDA